MNFVLEDLKKPFAPEDIEWRIQQVGKKQDGSIWARVLAYVDNRAIMNRLDEVVGAANWRNEFKEWGDKGVLCGISINIDGVWVTKWDGAEETDIEAVKGGLSSSMKRAAVQWGIGRYLYKLEADYAIITDKGMYYQAGKKDSYAAFKWNPPALPSWALPDGWKPSKEPQQQTQQQTQQEQPQYNPLTTAGMETAICSCESVQQLSDLYVTLTQEDMEFYKPVFTKRRKEIEGGK